MPHSAVPELATTVHEEPLNRTTSPAAVTAKTFDALLPHSPYTLAVEGKLIVVQAEPSKRSIVPLSPPANASVALAPQTAFNVAVVGVA